MPYIGEIRLMAGTVRPAGWAYCDGQLLPISENDALFIVLDTRYGGDGQETFGLPDLRGRVPVHQGNGYFLGEQGGVESVTLTTQQLPNHGHAALGSVATASSSSPADNVFATLPVAGVQATYGEDEPLLTLPQSAIVPVGGSQPHDNMQPYGVLNYVISLFGVFPSQT